MIRVEAVTVCVDYADFLRQTSKFNASLLERWIIVTRPSDHETRELCRERNLETVLTEDFGRGGAEFAKARGINRGLAMLSTDSWHLHLDADIVLPRQFLQLLEMAHLHPECIYGADRCMIHTAEEWAEFRKTNFLTHDYGHRVCPPKQLGIRWASPNYGYVPIGYFQLWHSSAEEHHGVKVRRYPDRHGDAARTDVQFALQWDRRQRVLLPEVIVAHLESERAKLGANWKGRTTKRFAS